MAAIRRELLGYGDKLSVHPGDTIRFMVSSEFPSYDAAIVRLIHGDTNPAGLGVKEEEIQTSVTGTYQGRHQETYPGSYVRVLAAPALDGLQALTIQAWIYPTTPALGRPQGVVTRMTEDGRGYGLFIEPDGRLAFRAGDSSGGVTSAVVAQPLRANAWYFVAAVHDPANGAIVVTQHLVPRWAVPDADQTATERVSGSAAAPSGTPLLIAAAYPGTGQHGRQLAGAHYNGKVDRPRLFSRALDGESLAALRDGADPRSVAGDALVAAWDFVAEASSTRVPDASGNGLHGEAINFPDRGMVGANWDGTAFDYAQAPEQYGAIHFHVDDIEDCGWEAAFELTVPDGLKSGVYAARIRAEDQEDYLPFYVRPPRGTATAKILYLAPTASYLAYANEQLAARDDMDFSVLTNIPIQEDPNDLYLHKHRELGASIYDLHADGSGITYSSWLRPILNMRPKHRYWILSAPRHFAADLYLVDWLETKGYEYDVATDLDLHQEGRELLDRYKVVITGSHPEYWSEAGWNTLKGYLEDGGRGMYLGGNGFYWVTGYSPGRSHIVEVRRGYAGIRSWESHPGELHLASTGEKGGLWRHRGRAPQALVGIGFISQGFDTKAPGYKQLPDRNDPRASWIFEGIGPDEMLGEFGLVMGGASGDEVDYVDHKLGTPPHTLRLATSEGMHSQYYLLVVEDIPLTIRNVDGTNNPLIKSDIIYFETPNDGAVFAAGSISFSGSLSHNNYDNNVSRMIGNVLDRFSQ